MDFVWIYFVVLYEMQAFIESFLFFPPCGLSYSGLKINVCNTGIVKDDNLCIYCGFFSFIVCVLQ